MYISFECIAATRKVYKAGDGSTPGSCMSCDPTYPFCAKGCQKLIDNLYHICDGVCLPDGYYFDPSTSYFAAHYAIDN